ncbi:hypothetical protein EJ08DRAFT_700259 [Tothia fuscella]|uniref:Alb1-domain-containing protein n=1 Tax=Tothia fuscella TaxID=1048955 RepID=A0A9P4TVQ9_9PEZI|nr:hypothetical protein EJ08DRAFT_700259 [Tothia fuscella]
MAKTTKAKKKDISIHSRAARRAASPSLNTDKSLKSAIPPASNPHVHIFANSAGIRKKKAKSLTRQQRLEREKRLERADIVNARMETRVEKSVGKLKIVKDRKKEWDKLNERLTNEDGKGGGAPKLKEGDEEMWEDVAEEDEDHEDADVSAGDRENMGIVMPGETLQLPILAHQPPAEIPLPPDEPDEIL